jgi:lysozyme family protein
MAKTDWPSLEPEYNRLWASMEIRSSWHAPLERRARAILANKPRYQAVSAKTGVPWFFIGVIHSLECGLSFSKHLHNGDSLKARTWRVPAGRPKNGSPPFTWEESACDALMMKSLDKVKDWSAARICFELERYNGFGYRTYHPGTLSPYLWSGSTHYVKGKYVADGKWSSTAVSQQTGAIPLLVKLAELDHSIVLGGAAPAVPEEVKSLPAVPTTTSAVVAASRKLSFLVRVRQFIVFCFTSIAALFTADNFEVAKGFITDVKDIAWSNALWIMVAAGVAVWLIAKYIESRSVKDAVEGRYIPSGA